MYKGTNPTALKSQQWLAEALIALIKEMPYEKITIQHICKKAGLSRQTFYNFFSTKDDIIRFWLQQIYEEELDKFETLPSMQDTIDVFICGFNKNKETLSLLVENKLDGIISDEMVSCVTTFAKKFVYLNKDIDETINYSIILIAGALAHLLLYCTRQQKNLSAEELSLLLKSFLSGELYKFG